MKLVPDWQWVTGKKGNFVKNGVSIKDEEKLTITNKDATMIKNSIHAVAIANAAPTVHSIWMWHTTGKTASETRKAATIKQIINYTCWRMEKGE